MGQRQRATKAFGLWRATISLLLGAFLTTLVAWQIVVNTPYLPSVPFRGERRVGGHAIVHSGSKYEHSWWHGNRGRIIVQSEMHDSPEPRRACDTVCHIDRATEPYPERLTRPVWFRSVAAERRTDPTRDLFMVGEDIVGWPFPALAGRTVYFHGTNDEEYRGSIIIPQAVKSLFKTSTYRAPASVLPVGFTINTFLYALPIYIVLSLAVSASGIRRRFTNRCVACGYSLENLNADSCPECGEAVRPRSQDDRTNRAETLEKTRSI